jgi:hypothetical protein
VEAATARVLLATVSGTQIIDVDNGWLCSCSCRMPLQILLTSPYTVTVSVRSRGSITRTYIGMHMAASGTQRSKHCISSFVLLYFTLLIVLETFCVHTQQDVVGQHGANSVMSSATVSGCSAVESYLHYVRGWY